MILSDNEIEFLQKRNKAVKENFPDSETVNQFTNLLDTIESKNKQIQQLQQGFMPQLEEALKDKKYYRDVAKDMQERLDSVKLSIVRAKFHVNMSSYGTAEEYILEALEAIERGGK